MKYLMLIIILVLMFGCNTDKQKDDDNWYCDKIDCGGIVMENTNMTGGSYATWNRRCDMINCTLY